MTSLKESCVTEAYNITVTSLAPGYDPIVLTGYVLFEDALLQLKLLDMLLG